MCPDNFQDLDPDSEYCYMISPDTNIKSWGDAHSECFAYESTLASIHSDNGMSKIQSALQGKVADIWIGLQADGKHKYIYYLIIISYNYIYIYKYIYIYIYIY